MILGAKNVTCNLLRLLHCLLRAGLVYISHLLTENSLIHSLQYLTLNLIFMLERLVQHQA